MACWESGRGQGAGVASREACSCPQQLSSALHQKSLMPPIPSLLGTVPGIRFVFNFPHSRFRTWLPASAKMPPVYLLSNSLAGVLISCCIHPAWSLSFIWNLFTVVSVGFQQGAKLSKCVQLFIPPRKLYCGFIYSIINIFLIGGCKSRFDKYNYDSYIRLP